MDEIELRIAALELLAIERLALDEPGRLLQIEASIREGLAGPGEPGDGSDEQAIRQHALQVVREATMRHDEFSAGFLLRKARSG